MNLKNKLSICFVGMFFIGLVNVGQALEKGEAAISVNLYEKTDSSAMVYRKMITDDVAISAGLAVRQHESEQTGNKYDAVEIIGGGRKYLVTTGLRQFAEAEMRYVKVDFAGSSASYKGHGSILGIYYGVEYFVGKRFSFDGRAGAEYIYIDYDEEGSSDRTDAPNVRLGLNYYWD